MARPKNSAINTKPTHKAIIYCVAFWPFRYAAGTYAFFFIFFCFYFFFSKMFFFSLQKLKPHIMKQSQISWNLTGYCRGSIGPTMWLLRHKTSAHRLIG
jgi:hypothetical protein